MGEPLPAARRGLAPLLGELGVRRSSAQVTRHYAAERLIGQQVLAVVNLPPRRIGPFVSEVLTLGVPDASGEA